VATLVNEAANAVVVHVYVTDAPAASVPIERAQPGVVGSVTETLDNAVSPVLVTVIENVTKPPANTEGVSVLFAMLIDGLITTMASLSASVTFGPTGGFADTEAVFVNEAVAETVQLMLAEAPTANDGITWPHPGARASVTVTAVSATSPVLVTVTENEAFVPLTTTGVVVFFTSEIAG
jgi:hypothetical protein